jgi:hypothetical protein
MFVQKAAAIIVGLSLLSTTTVAQSPTTDRVKFGPIGYYVFYDGRAQFLRWPQPISKQFKETAVLKIPKNAEFYAYGLDFSHAYVSALAKLPLAPPHLAGIGMAYLKKNGEFAGLYTSMFVPLPGYPEKAYRIYLDGLPEIMYGNVEYDYFALRVVPDNPTGITGEGYLFRFQEDDAKTASLVDTFAGKITSGSPMDGNLSAVPFAVLGAQSPQDLKIVFQTSGYNASTNTFSAVIKLVAEGKQINFEGIKVSPRELKLTRSDDKNTSVYLFLRGDGMLVGAWTQTGLLNFTNLNAVIKVE